MKMVVVESYALAVIAVHHHALLGFLGEHPEAGLQRVEVPALLLGLCRWASSCSPSALAFTAGSTGSVEPVHGQPGPRRRGGPLWSAFLGGVVFNLSNILLVCRDRHRRAWPLPSRSVWVWPLP